VIRRLPPSRWRRWGGRGEGLGVEEFSTGWIVLAESSLAAGRGLRSGLTFHIHADTHAYLHPVNNLFALSITSRKALPSYTHPATMMRSLRWFLEGEMINAVVLGNHQRRSMKDRQTDVKRNTLCSEAITPNATLLHLTEQLHARRELDSAVKTTRPALYRASIFLSAKYGSY
jgi:hypothetical protein